MSSLAHLLNEFGFIRVERELKLRSGGGLFQAHALLLPCSLSRMLSCCHVLASDVTRLSACVFVCLSACICLGACRCVFV